ncbi:hypothetical protein N7448_001190 [Penicillium atrosanguineum]|nr:hypothetical protein N7448_001190 [Penicillium atrosanguineum]
MDSPPFDPSSSRQMPQSLPVSALQDMLDADLSGDWAPDNPTVDWDAPNNFYFCSSEPSNLEWPPWTGLDSSATSNLERHSDSALQTLEVSNEALQSPPSCTTNYFHPQSLSNVSQWLDGAYRPSVPCTHCRRHRLQCLILRTTEANPNPVKSCSSCVALFRECSLAKGTKRLPSGFETFSPVLGHMHGLPEQTEDINQENDIIATVEPTEDRKDSKQFVRKGARVLREWFLRNQEYPYPTEDQKAQLCQETGFSQRRISTWFANARRRQKQKIQTANVATPSRFRSGSPLVTSTISSLTPMERWQGSPPEDEPVPEATIQDAIASCTVEADATMDPFQFDPSTLDLFNFDETSSHLASSVSSFGSRASETSESVSSAWSYQSGGDGGLPFPLLPKAHRPRRRGRQHLSGDEGQYQCTFCTQSFRKRHDWSRHEKSVHLQLDSWICTPNLHELQQQYDCQVAECYFCETPFPAPAHWEEHEFHICSAKPAAERSFSRKDYLWQHLRKFHACTKSPVNLDAWHGAGPNVQSRCGFCDYSLSTWAARVEHIAEHFKNGARIQQWVGDWGLDSSAMSVLRNAILPSQRSLASPST